MMTNKPFVKDSEITYDMLMTHPYFKTLTIVQLQNLIRSLHPTVFNNLPGAWVFTKSKQLFEKLQESKKAPVYNNYVVYAATSEEAIALSDYQKKLFGIGCGIYPGNYYRFNPDRTDSYGKCGTGRDIEDYKPGNVIAVEHIFASFQDWKAYMDQKEEAKPDDRKIVGYKLPVSIYNNNIPAGTVYRICDAAYVAVPVSNIKGDMSNSLPSEIVKTWEPIYEEQKPKAFHVIITGTPHTEFIIQVDGIIRIPEFNTNMSIDNLRSIIKSLTETVRFHALHSEKIDINTIHLHLGIEDGITINYGELLTLEQIYKVNYE